MKKSIIALFLFIALLSACSGAELESPAPAKPSTQTEQSVETAEAAASSVKATFPDYAPYDCSTVSTEPDNPNRVFCINQDDSYRTLDGKDGRPSDVAMLSRIMAVFPRRMRERIVEVEFAEEDLGEGVAAVMDMKGDGVHWSMWVNTNSESRDSERELMGTIAHELMHYLTLNDTQRSDDKQSCGEAIKVLEYCPKEGTVFKDYINRFWQPIWKDWGSGDYNDYYDDHPDDFVTPYAVTDPGEDIAESFSEFIFTEKPADLSLLKNQKIDYFWQFPEFVTAREAIRSNLDALPESAAAPAQTDGAPSEDAAASSAGSDNCLPHGKHDAATDTCYIDISCETEEECNAIIASLYEGYDVEPEYWEMTAEDCLPGESYDPEGAVCYIECSTDEECQELADQTYSGLDVYFSDSFGGRSADANWQSSQNSASGEDEAPPIARYTLDAALDLVPAGVDQNETNPAYTNPERHEEIWLYTRRVLPKNVLKEEARQYHIFTDGPDGTLAYVSPLPDDPRHWLFAVDIEDAGASGSLGKGKEFIHTIIHEFAHIVTLENNQVPPDPSISSENDAPTETELTCKAFYTGEGCAKAQSYINLFYARFWADIYGELNEVNNAVSDEEREEASYAFYQKYQDRFVTEYAATNPGEDIAESFTFFVLKAKPAGNSIAEQKVRFFYAFKPLVQMRNQIRSQLARINQAK